MQIAEYICEFSITLINKAKAVAKISLLIEKLASELQIRGDIEENSKIIFLFLNENICCDPSLEPSQ